MAACQWVGLRLPEFMSALPQGPEYIKVHLGCTALPTCQSISDLPLSSTSSGQLCPERPQKLP